MTEDTKKPEYNRDMIFRQQVFYWAARTAHDEGIREEEQMVARVNQIVDDAMIEEPVTLAGQTARANALAYLEKADNGEIPAEKLFDYNKLRDETSFKAACEILSLIGSKGDKLVLKMTATEEEKAQVDVDYRETSKECLDIMSRNNVGIKELDFIFGEIQRIGDVLGKICLQQISGHKEEILSRTIGTRNPGNQKFDDNHATYADLIQALERVRKETGDKPEDYFHVENK